MTWRHTEATIHTAPFPDEWTRAWCVLCDGIGRMPEGHEHVCCGRCCGWGYFYERRTA